MKHASEALRLFRKDPDRFVKSEIVTEERFVVFLPLLLEVKDPLRTMSREMGR